MRDGTCQKCQQFTKVSDDGKDCDDKCPTHGEYMVSDGTCQKCDKFMRVTNKYMTKPEEFKMSLIQGKKKPCEYWFCTME